MSPLFTIIGGFIILGFLGMCLGIFIGCVVAPIVYKVRKIPSEKRRFIGMKRVLAIAAIAIMTPILHLTIWTISWSLTKDSYTQYSGEFDYFRAPLIYPYDLSYIDITDRAFLGNWKRRGRTLDFGGITEIRIVDSIIVGRRGPTEWDTDSPVDWFILKCATNELAQYGDSVRFAIALDSLNIPGDLELQSVDEYYGEYWSENHWFWGMF